MIPPEKISSFLPEFHKISDAWLAMKNTRERGFSLGFFDEGYLKHFSAGIVRHGGKIVAFANIWTGAKKAELSADLVRCLPQAPPDAMEYLLIRLMLWGKQQGYQWFNLGMAPLSGLEDHALVPSWNRLAVLVCRHGEHFDNFQGLRQYKEKFHPEWELKYLVCPGGTALLRIFTNLASLIPGGLKGIAYK